MGMGVVATTPARRRGDDQSDLTAAIQDQICRKSVRSVYAQCAYGGGP
jgi:hypothetical protein